MAPDLADLLEDFLNQLELIRSKGVVLTKVLGVLVVIQGHPATREGKLALEDVPLFSEHTLQFVLHVFPFGEQPGLDDFIDVGAG